MRQGSKLALSPRICDTVAKFAPVRALWARRGERSGAGGGKSQNKRPELLDSNQATNFERS